jgi:hypothetical protein
VTWASIPHKLHPDTSKGDSTELQFCSFPDASYFDRCNQELDRWGVPCFEKCEEYTKADGERRRQLDRKPMPKGVPVESNKMLGLQATDACRTILKALQSHQHGWMFCKALPTAATCEISCDKIDKPMDLSTVEDKLNYSKYTALEDFVADVILTFDTALATHGKENPVHFMAKQLKKKFKKDLKELLPHRSY